MKNRTNKDNLNERKRNNRARTFDEKDKSKNNPIYSTNSNKQKYVEKEVIKYDIYEVEEGIEFKDMSVLDKFVTLTEYTQILGQEHEMKHFLPDNVITDEIGNYYLKIGTSDTMFTCHLDTAAHKKEKVYHVVENNTTKGEQIFVSTDKTTVLGADDRTGVLIILHMIENNVPGLYYFFIGEERGTVGSSGILKSNPTFFKDYKKCIAFDRRSYGSVISKQYGSTCCSPAFSEALVNEMNIHTKYQWKDDPTGIYTDSAVFMNIIPEITNLSVGYFNEHTEYEYQNITYLERLCKAVVNVDWENLPIERINKKIDTEYPTRNRRSGTVSPDNHLQILFNVVESMIEEVFEMECLNGFGFIPEKEMLFENWTDDTKYMSVFIHDDASITIGRDHFIDLKDLHEKVELYYGFDMSTLYEYDDIEEEEDDEDDYNDELYTKSYNKSDEIDEEEVEIFEDNIDLVKFIKDVKKLLNGKQKGYITASKMDNLLDKYNVTIESLVTWIFHNKNNSVNTKGLIWDNHESEFYFEESLPY